MGGDQEWNEGGQFEPACTDDDVIEAVAENDPAGTPADELGIARRSADYRLRRGLDDKRVSKKKIGISLV